MPPITFPTPLATRADLEAALPPAPDQGAVADWRRARITLNAHRAELASTLANLDAADIAGLLDAAVHDQPLPTIDATSHTVEHELRIIERAITAASRHETEAQRTDVHWLGHVTRCDAWRRRWQELYLRGPRVDAITEQDVRPQLLDALAAELAAAQDDAP